MKTKPWNNVQAQRQISVFIQFGGPQGKQYKTLSIQKLGTKRMFENEQSIH